MSLRARWLVGTGLAVTVIGLGIWLVAADVPAYRFLVRLCTDQEFLRDRLQALGFFGPFVFIAIQALQVVLAPVPGEVTGFLGGYVFGEWLGFVYSSVGLSLGSMLAFGVGRWLGAPFVRRVVQPQIWKRLGFIVEAEGAILCFVVYLIPGFPKDIVCYLFGLSPMPFWLFAMLSSLGRMPGTWVLSTQGAKTASGQYVEIALVTAAVAAVAIPLYYYRDRILSRFRGRTQRSDEYTERER